MKRYKIFAELFSPEDLAKGAFNCMEAENGRWVLYSDHQAEIYRLTKDNTALTEKVKRLQLQTQWQPIETAPKGDEYILSKDMDGVVSVVTWWGHENLWRDAAAMPHEKVYVWMPLPK